MNTSSATDMFIEDLIDATYPSEANAREKHVFRQALLGLVWLAKSEQVLEIRTTVDKLIGDRSLSSTRQRTKSRQRDDMHSGRWPQQLEFNQFD